MSKFFTVGSNPISMCIAQLPVDRGRMYATEGGCLSSARFSTDSVGTFNATFNGINAGSEIRVYLADGTEIAGVESCDADHVLSWNRYAAGNANNDVDIHIISTVYENIELAYTTPTADASIPIQQRRQRFTSY